ncbi:hypothetical protein L2E75_22140 [Planktothrix agardhii 1807]|uniref:hypothetical protein n=1 Tax=Planktothrix agardhii TaxID=1160 RepID=UPI001F15EB68|nr:hypothetical protein [Planktothrix agardhii]MCF3568807.1 hypothetical protein [Planktothrix agardhii 1807]
MKSQILLITKPVAVKTAIVLGLSLSLITHIPQIGNNWQRSLAYCTLYIVCLRKSCLYNGIAGHAKQLVDLFSNALGATTNLIIYKGFR